MTSEKVFTIPPTATMPPLIAGGHDGEGRCNFNSNPIQIEPKHPINRQGAPVSRTQIYRSHYPSRPFFTFLHGREKLTTPEADSSGRQTGVMALLHITTY